MALEPDRPGDALAARVDGIAAWIHDLDERVRAAEVASGDEKTARELRRAIEALSKHDPKLEKRLTNRVDVLADRLATLASTVSTAAAALARKDGEIATLRREMEDASRRVETLVAQIGKGAPADELDNLRSAVRALQTERPARSADSRLEGLEGKLAFLSERIDTLAGTVATTAAGLVGREGEIANLRERLEQGSARIEQTAAELRSLRGSATLAGRFDALQRAVDETREGLDARERDVAALRGRIDEAYARVGAVVAEIQTSISSLAAQVAGVGSATDQALDARTDELNVRLDGLAAALEAAHEASAQRDGELERVSAAVDRLQDELANVPETAGRALDARAGALGERLDGLAATLEAATQGAAEREAALRQQLEAEIARLGERFELIASAAEAPEDHGPALRALTTRVETAESGHTTVAAEVARIAQTLDAERRALRAELERLAAVAASDAVPALRAEMDTLAAAVANGAKPPNLAELTARLESVERAGASVATDVARTTAFWASELQAVEARLDALAVPASPVKPDPELRNAVAAVEGRVDDLSAQLAELAAQARDLAEPPPSDEVKELHVAVDGLRMRLASSEQELATLVGSRDLVARIEELTRRVDSVERAPIALAPTDGGAGAGDGRFRLELRALELRMGHAEAAARENREAVLVQLERLAARIEWRFQRLEAEYEQRHPQAVGGGRVVPLRPPAEV